MIGIGYFLVLGGIILAIIQADLKWRIIIISLIIVTGTIRVFFTTTSVIVAHLIVFVIISIGGYGYCIWNNVFDPWIKKMKMM